MNEAIRAVFDHAYNSIEDDYFDGGWDYVVEVFDDEDIENIILERAEKYIINLDNVTLTPEMAIYLVGEEVKELDKARNME